MVGACMEKKLGDMFCDFIPPKNPGGQSAPRKPNLRTRRPLPIYTAEYAGGNEKHQRKADVAPGNPGRSNVQNLFLRNARIQISSEGPPNFFGALSPKGTSLSLTKTSLSSS